MLVSSGGLAAEGIGDQSRLFFCMQIDRTASGRRRRRTAGVADGQVGAPLAHHALQIVTGVVPGALVHGLFLAPGHILDLGERRQRFDQALVRERVQLFDTHDGDLVELLLVRDQA